MPNCRNCGVELEGDEKFCYNCGHMQEEQTGEDCFEKREPDQADHVESQSAGRAMSANRKRIGIIALVSLLLVGALIFAVFNFSTGLEEESAKVNREKSKNDNNESTEDVLADVEKTHTITGLFPLTGVLSSFGENSSEVAKLAVADINEWLEEQNKTWRLNLEIADTKASGYESQRRMQHWLNEGVKFFVGPMSSAAVSECLPFANANSILFISPSSTSTDLAIADDWLFRFCADDSRQSLAIAGIAADIGLSHLIVGSRNDYWANNLHESVVEACRDQGITISDAYQLSYDPNKSSFSNEVKLLDGYLAELETKGIDLENVGFCLISLNEAANFLAEASKYPRLSRIAWIGSDGTVHSESLKTNPEAAGFAVQVNFINPINRPSKHTEQSAYDHVSEHIRTVLGRECDGYSYNTYDIIWALAMAIDKAGYDSKAVKEVFPAITDQWSSDYGASGHIILNQYGDRAYADYDYWLINNNLEWENVAYYEGSSGIVNWFRRLY